MSKFDELKKLAEAATRGPWEVKVDKHPHFRNGNHTEHRIRTAWVHGQLKDHYPVVTTSVGIPEFEKGKPCHMVSISKEDAAYIAAANPAAILELLAIQAQLVEPLKDLDDSFCSINEFSTKEERHQARMNLIAARAAITAVEVKP